MSVRPRTLADEEALVALEAANERFHAAGSPDFFRERTDVMLPPDFPNDVEREILVAEIDGRVVGFVDVRVQSVPERQFFVARRLGFVVQIVVAEAERNRGIGRTLMQAAATWARERDCDIVELNVYEFNAGAHHLYTSLGYTTTSRILQLKLS